MMRLAIFGTANCSFGPEVDERIDVARDRIRRIDHPQDVVNEDVRDERTNEKKRGRSRIVDVDDPGSLRAFEIPRKDLFAAARRTVLAARIERQHERRIAALMHRDDHVLRHRFARERNPLLGQLAQDDARIGRRVDVVETEDARRQRDASTHRGIEERLLRFEMAEQRGRSDVKLAGDIGERRCGEAFLREDDARGLEDLIAADGRRSAHL